jgi:hypothetical protein
MTYSVAQARRYGNARGHVPGEASGRVPAHVWRWIVIALDLVAWAAVINGIERLFSLWVRP